MQPSAWQEATDECRLGGEPVERDGTAELFFFNDTATTEIYTLSLHDALPICARQQSGRGLLPGERGAEGLERLVHGDGGGMGEHAVRGRCEPWERSIGRAHV